MRYLVILLLAFSACNNVENSDQTETEQTEETSAKSYGEDFQADNPLNLSTMLTKLEEDDSVFVTVKGEITSTCKMKGCWMKIKLPDGDEMRVTFKDYGFFVPKEGMEGKIAVMDGYVKRTVTDEATRKHFAEDAGKSEEEIASITGDEKQLSFVASGVKIYN